MKYWLNTIFICLTVQLHGQIILAPEPELVDTYLFIDKQRTIELEKREIDFNSDFSQSSEGYYVSGAKSPIRIPKADTLMFIIKLPNNPTDPLTSIEIHRLEVNLKQGTRTFDFANIKDKFLPLSAPAEQVDIDFKIKKYGEDSFFIYIKKLRPGEYAFTLSRGYGTFNLFGVD